MTTVKMRITPILIKDCTDHKRHIFEQQWTFLYFYTLADRIYRLNILDQNTILCRQLYVYIN